MLNAKGITNCPNCGAPITSEKCPYCGTLFYDFSCIDIQEPTYLKIKHNGHIVMCKAYVKECSISVEPEYRTVTMLGENMPRLLKINEHAQVQLAFDVVNVDGILFTAVKED